MTSQEIIDLVRQVARDALNTDLTQVRYGNLGLAWWLLLLILAAVTLAILRYSLFRRRHSRQHSGHAIERPYRRGLVPWLCYAAPTLLLAAAIGLMLVASADPFLMATEEVAGSVDSRARVDLVDVSGSMGWALPATGKAKATVAREAHLRFLEMRRGKNDRVSLWLFSTDAYMVDDFVTDDELYYFQLWDAPYVIAQNADPHMIVPTDKIRLTPAEGQTNIVRPLDAIVRHFDQDELTSGQPGGEHRALLIVTDAAVHEFPTSELEALAKRRITPYIIYINTSPPSANPPETPPLIMHIRDYGGEYFDIRDPDGLDRAYRAIDAREAVRYQVKHRAFKVPIYSRFLLVAIALLVVGVPWGFAAELFWGVDP